MKSLTLSRFKFVLTVILSIELTHTLSFTKVLLWQVGKRVVLDHVGICRFKIFETDYFVTSTTSIAELFSQMRLPGESH